MSNQDRSRSLSPSRSQSPTTHSHDNNMISPDQMDYDDDDVSSSELIRGYRMDRLRNQTIEERKIRLLKNVTRHCNDAVTRGGDLTTEYRKSLIDEDLQEWLVEELSERGVDSYYTSNGFYLKIFLDNAFLQPYQDDDDTNQDEDDTNQEYDSEEDDQKPSYHNQLVLLLLVLAVAALYYIKVCYLSNTVTSTGCKEVVGQYFNRTAQQFISHATTTEENTDMFG